MTSKFAAGTLPDHNWCTVHRTHMLGCAQYEQLLARSGQCCEICGLPSAKNRRGKLHIDHDHLRPDWAVRGLLCNRCNNALTKEVAEAQHPWAADYLANSWWIRECERLDVPTSPSPEPDYGSAICDQFGAMWMREGDGKWRPQGGIGRPGISWASWEWLYDHRGPHNMALLDPDTPGLWRSAEVAMLLGLAGELGTADVLSRRRHRWPRPSLENYWSVA